VVRWYVFRRAESHSGVSRLGLFSTRPSSKISRSARCSPGDSTTNPNSDQSALPGSQAASVQTGASITSAPYETVLIKAFDKLTSQIFIFLLAYLILVIGMAVLAPQLTTQVRTLLNLLPVLGIGAYAWQKRKSIAGEARRHGIDVKAGIVTGGAQVIGVQSASASASVPKDVSVGAGLASGQSRVAGVVLGQEESSNNAADARYLLETFQQLDRQKRRKLISSAQKLLDEP
jgi:hypothetical protein